MTKGYKHMSPEQIQMAKRWRSEGVSYPDIGARLQRPAGTVYKHIAKGNVKTNPKGYIYIYIYMYSFHMRM